jgi:hypothetical protein
VVLVAERVARDRVLEADDRGDVACGDLLDRLALVGVDTDEATDGARIRCPWAT